MDMLRIGLVGLLAIALVAPGGAAHPGALAFDNPATGARCYVFESSQFVEFWVESNGITTGGTPLGLGTTNHQVDEAGDLLGDDALLGHDLWDHWVEAFPTGLQRRAGDHDGDGDLDPADTRYADEAAWALACGLP